MQNLARSILTSPGLSIETINEQIATASIFDIIDRNDTSTIMLKAIVIRRIKEEWANESHCARPESRSFW